jgi:hypothetical protein
MTHFLRYWPAPAALLALGLFAAVGRPAADPPAKGVWTDPADPTLPPDFKVQGEYVGELRGNRIGCQVIALGGSAFQAVVLPGGLPGDGWDGHDKILMDGRLEEGRTTFRPTAGPRKYLAQSPATFSATSQFPPPGQKDYSAVVENDTLTGKTDDGTPFELKKTVRKSPTLGAKPPEGAVVLFDSTNTDEWAGGRLDREHGTLNTDAHDILSKRKFTDYTLHVEFLLPYKPDARGQARANSGVYMVDIYEVQVLDSFGLDGKNNECAGVYTLAAPSVNMCYPPLTWQTYDIDFKSAVAEGDRKVQNARITMKHNGVPVHDDVELKGKTGGARNEPEGTPGPIRLQGHGNPLQYRNVWVVEKK